ncbi:MAG: hypothetical protein H6621_12150 [Halobacteriovoraceae bacterium]|nr:hypothetical protein [Halobacteriovoraceae bacterium]MCB9095812.1 hypothetical protein [Halobacteriovoraceae bacterium]
MKDIVFGLAHEFSSETHGSSNYDEDSVFVMGKNSSEYVPLSYISKKEPRIKSVKDLQSAGFIYSSADFLEDENFSDWYKSQFNKKLINKTKKSIGILNFPDELTILDSIQNVVKLYGVLREHNVINNGKNFPVQLGEWYAKCIFGLKQVKSSSQRGFDFYNEEDKRVEVMVHWNDRSSPKGVKLKKSLVDLSDYCIIIYMGSNFMLRDILMLDSDFIMRKFSGKGHTIFLKDNMVSSYFFSHSSKHFDKVVSKNLLMKFSSPHFAMKLDSAFEKNTGA